MDSKPRRAERLSLPHIGVNRLRPVAIAVAAVLMALAALLPPAPSVGAAQALPNYYLPNPQASKLVTVTKTGHPETEIIVLTQRIAVKETGPRQTIDKFGEVYDFEPSFIAVHRDQPTEITFWNLQPDDNHDFALLGPDNSILMYEPLPPLTKNSYIFTFHREGLFNFKCMQHQPAMSGQFLVLPPAQ